ncbi:MAG: LacI family transcriptional regulator [Clostridiales bacterium]|nr:LacI family transcriptional regulator [Clostridiales bacterium]
MVTIKEIAARAGVSTATVSNVLHGNLKKVSPATMERIRKLIDEMGYVQAQDPHVVQKGGSHLVAVIVQYQIGVENSLLTDPFYGMVIGVIEQTLQKHGYYMLFYSSDNMDKVFKTIMDWDVDGVLAISFSDVNCEKLYRMMKKPIISVDCFYSGRQTQSSVPNIGLDDHMGGYLMARRLMKMGYRSVFVCGYRNYGIDAWRWQGTQRALEEAGEKGGGCKLNMIELGLTLEEREHSYREILQQMPFRCRTALFFTADILAMEASYFFIKNGVKIPEDVGIAGFGDTSETIGFSILRLTTVRQDLSAKGRLAVEELVKAIGDPTYKMRSHLLPVSLVLRDSL